MSYSHLNSLIQFICAEEQLKDFFKIGLVVILENAISEQLNNFIGTTAKNKMILLNTNQKNTVNLRKVNLKKLFPKCGDYWMAASSSSCDCFSNH